jgi:CarD family transcriptional regulator
MRWVAGKNDGRRAGAGVSTLAVGDRVVYASHGVGQVTVRETRETVDADAEVVVVELREGLSVTLPLERALEYLRPVSSEVEIVGVQNVLRGSVPPEQPWRSRLRGALEKVAVGDVVSLAEVVRDVAWREHELKERGNGSVLSLAERNLYRKARCLLADEIGMSRGVDSTEADAWIDRQLAHDD